MSFCCCFGMRVVEPQFSIFLHVLERLLCHTRELRVVGVDITFISKDETSHAGQRSQTSRRSVNRQIETAPYWQGSRQLYLLQSGEPLTTCPFRSLGKVTHTTELSKVDIAFRLLKLDNAYVCNAGRLVGMITRESLANFVDLREVSPMDDCVRCVRVRVTCRWDEIEH